MNRKRVIWSTVAVGAAGAAAASVVLLKDRNNRERLMETYNEWSQKMKDTLSSQENLPIDKAGFPDPQDIDDNKMVSEGAQFGVQYFNAQEQDSQNNIHN
ncbi:hypothetical protein G4V62_06080 [Bacillaceae bacterium SIJ1]|uniref:hypothetical protein n=1 Tax=Litoribacterium kuwaitense TaxID=1398745 RepID=UPI0013EDA67C|nr:hypothetical protein [Litoribacterium kuwaitense]NGP44545.1 hypothetical protein [Litoribacterium kuwaitense]